MSKALQFREDFDDLCRIDKVENKFAADNGRNGMLEQKARATVDIYGEQYIMRGDATPEYMKMLANYIDKKMKHIAARQPQLSVAKIAVLAALNIADEFSKLQEDYDTLVKMMDSDKKEDKKSEKKKV